MEVVHIVIGCIVALSLALYSHLSRFGNSEYNRSTWQNNIKMYGRLAIFGAVLFGIYVFYAMNTGTPIQRLTKMGQNSLNMVRMNRT